MNHTLRQSILLAIGLGLLGCLWLSINGQFPDSRWVDAAVGAAMLGAIVLARKGRQK